MSDLAILCTIKGLIAPDEGAQLAALARVVPASQAIVEVGAHRGLSSCWLGHGSRTGNRAHVTSIDPWPDTEKGSSEDVPWANEGALEKWQENIERMRLAELVTPRRSTGQAVAAEWTGPVGLWFHDADHAYESVRDDYLAWLPHLAPGAWIAVHDYYGNSPDGHGGWRRDGSYATVIEDHILPSGAFGGVQIVNNLWIGRRI